MSLFVLHCLDAEGKFPTRMSVRESHLAYVRDCGISVLLAGPMLSDDGAQLIGSLFVVDVPDRAAAEAFSANDPYVKADVFGSVQIHPFRWVVNPPSTLA
jgi:uncharacterized protein YciI